MNEARHASEETRRRRRGRYRGHRPEPRYPARTATRRTGARAGFSRVLVPLDGSSASERALAHARSVARASGARIDLLRVLRPGRAGGITRDSVEWRQARGRARSYLEELARAAGDGELTVHPKLREGRAAEEIVGFAREHGVDLVVMSTHGRGDGGFRLGSVARKVVDGVGVSVLLVRPEDDGAPRPEEPLDLRRVLVPVDCSPVSDCAVALAATLARTEGARLELVHVVPRPEMPRHAARSEERRRLRRELVRVNRKSAMDYLERTRERFEAPDLHVDLRLVEDERVTRTLHRVAEEESGTLTVVCAHGASGAAPWPYGSVTEHLLTHGRGPLLVIQDQTRTGRPAAVREAATAGVV